MNTKIKSFTHLTAWQKAHELVLKMYKFTKTFPKDELYGLVSQLRRAVVSITSNLAEGFYRRTSSDKNHFYTTAITSLAEVQNQLLIARDLGYISNDLFQEAARESVEVHKLINGLIKSSRTKS